LDSFTIRLASGASCYTFALADAARADQMINQQLDVAEMSEDPGRAQYLALYGPSRQLGCEDGFYHGAGSAGYFELHPRLWQGWCAETEVPDDPLPELGDRPLFGYAVIVNSDLCDDHGEPMGALRNPLGLDVHIVRAA
jgi:hypothetical protein